MAESRRRTVIGLIVPSISINDTGSAAEALWGGKAGASERATASTAGATRRRRPFIATPVGMIARRSDRLPAGAAARLGYFRRANRDRSSKSRLAASRL